METDSALETDLDFKVVERLELELSDKDVRKDPERLAEILHQDFEEIGKSGRVFSKSAILSLLTNEEHQPITYSQFRFTKLSDNSVLLKYQSHCNGISARRSSVWIKNKDHWQILYHQGTVC